MTTVPLSARFDAALGGRWTSLSSGHREWLWQRRDVARAAVAPGAGFVDAGGLEECLPTVRGNPDHGDIWSRPWYAVSPGEFAAETPDFTLTRRITGRDGAVVAGYRLSAAPGYRFVWAAHALLDLSPLARLEAPSGTRTRVYPDPAPPVEGPWPAPLGVPLDRLGPDDGTAIGAVLQDCPRVTVTDGPDRLTWELECDGQPRSVALWRNLRGWPATAPYRSIGVEPMLGGAFGVAEDVPAAVVPAGGELSWQLIISASRGQA
ncbi:hypothetical protein Q0Z83_026120 [Actinoplanes sichuanensis]|uniref:Galactose mutarotase n=1 Tax=Actinoplanes sichuanensis TaxID=512349 RepID=A0ABW4AU33_9ACTN|nr:hypothetical protein [Actinoplanes sichuanensis]BEL04421.1 hypothetical protein Q0Z83_026120 [Actinoplanes sichuanensis]